MTARNGLGAVTAAANSAPHTIIMDIGLPCMDGYEAACRIRAHESKSWAAVLITLTGWAKKPISGAYEAGFDQHWVKTVSLDQLKAN